MTIAVRQIWGWDPNPNNTGGIGGTGGAHFVAAPPLATLSGSTIVAISCIAAVGGQTITGMSDVTNGAYSSLNHFNNTSFGLDCGLYTLSNAGVIPAGSNGISTATSTTSLTDSTKSWTTNQWVGATLTDYFNGGTYTVTSNTATTLSFAAGTAPTVGKPYVVGGYVSSLVSNNDDYQASLCMEISGAATSSLAGNHAAQGTFTTGTNNISTGTAALGSSQILAIGFCVNDSDNNTPYVPLAGSGLGYTDSGAYWIFNLGQGIARLEYAVIANPGTMDMKFSGQSSSDHHMAFMIGIKDVGGAVSNILQPWQQQGGMGVQIAS